VTDKRRVQLRPATQISAIRAQARANIWKLFISVKVRMTIKWTR